MLRDIECFYHPPITLWVEMKEKLIGRFLYDSISHITKLARQYDQHTYDHEFVARTASNLVEIKTILNQML